MVTEELNQERRPAKASPELKRYQSYRVFLGDWFAYKKSLRPGFSYRRFSGLLSLKSPNFLQLVISGQRNLSPELAGRIAKALSLTPPERSYFLALVKKESTRTKSEFEEAEKLRRISLRKLLNGPVSLLQEKIFTRWHHMLVRELVFLPDFEPSGEYISAQLNGMISVEEAEESFALLCKGGFLKREKDGRYRPVDPLVDSGDSVFTHEFMQKHHGETLAVWGKHLEKLNTPDQELGLLHIPINSEKIPELRQRIRKFQDEIIGWLESEQNPDRVVQLGTYLIPFGEKKS
ncbi:MAG: TIGR02147 family protein [Bdellovibrionota bacterium]